MWKLWKIVLSYFTGCQQYHGLYAILPSVSNNQFCLLWGTKSNVSIQYHLLKVISPIKINVNHVISPVVYNISLSQTILHKMLGKNLLIENLQLEIYNFFRNTILYYWYLLKLIVVKVCNRHTDR